MKKTMLDYIRETPAVGRRNIERRDELTDRLSREFLAGQYRRVVIIASGSSYNASVSARPEMERVLGRDVKIVHPFTFDKYENEIKADDFVFAITQSGRSVNTLEALDRVRSLGRKAIAVTGNPDGEVRNHCDAAVDFGVGVETVGYVTKGFVTTVLFLLLFAYDAGVRCGSLEAAEAKSKISDLFVAMDAYESSVDICLDFFNRYRSVFLRMKRLQICGYGPNLGTAMEGALKVGETFGIPSTAYEIEEFMHGGYLELTREHVVLILDSGGAGRERARQLFDVLPVATKNAILITEDRLGGARILRVPGGAGEFVTPLYLSAFFQIMSYQICTELDIWEKDPSIHSFESLIKSKTKKPEYLEE